MRPAWGLLLLLEMPLMGWGTKGHAVAAEGSLRTLPPNLRAWYLEQEPAFIRAALEPDLWKEHDPSEVWRHRIYCEAYGGSDKVPLQASIARGLVSSWTFENSGQLPWVIAERYRLLVKAFQAGDRKGVVAASGWLCHYIADAQVPLHTTRNRNGKLTGQKGVHKRWETDLLRHGPDAVRNLRAAAVRADLPAVISVWIVDSHAMVAPLLKADQSASHDAHQDGSSPDELFWMNQKGPVLQQLQRSAEYTGDLLLSAWTEAGKPLHP